MLQEAPLLPRDPHDAVTSNAAYGRHLETKKLEI